jgi:protease I
MEKKLNGKRVAILVADGFEQAELTGPKEALEAAGAETEIVSPNEESVAGWHHYDAGDLFDVDVPLAEADPANYDALLLPGGVANPDQLRMKPEAVRFVKAFFDAGKPVAAICHGPWVLCSTQALKGRRATCFFAIKDDVINAGAQYVDAEVVRDGNVITSRKPDDLPAFLRTLMQAVREAEPALAARR